MKHRASIPVLLASAGFCLLLFASIVGKLGADTNATAKAAGAESLTPTQVNNQGEVLLAAQALEQLRRDIEAAAARNTAAITSSLAVLDPLLGKLHDQQMKMVQSSNRTVLTVGAIFAGLGFIGLMFIVTILARTLGRFSEIAGNASRGLVLAAPAGPAEMVNVNANAHAVEQASGRFQHAIDHLQKRILELEQAAVPAALEAGKPQPSAGPQSLLAANISPLPAHDAGVRKSIEAAESASHASLLLGKGQALLNLDQAEQALACFDEILAHDPNHTEALLRRGLALEKMENWEKALESYERALAIDSSLTVAYLYKGGVCNKLQRHREALDSYEHALHSEKRSRAS